MKTMFSDFLYFSDVIFLSFGSTLILFFGLAYRLYPGLVSVFKISKFLLCLMLLFALVLNLDLLFVIFFKYRVFGVFSNLLRIDTLSTFSRVVIICTGLIVALLSYKYEVHNKLYKVEFIFLFVLVVVGACLLVCANNILTLYLAFELQTIPLYMFVSAFRFSKVSVEAGIKYFLLSTFSSGVMLFGIALLYFVSGVSSFSDLNTFIFLSSKILFIASNQDYTVYSLIFFTSFFLIFLGLLFKLAVSPFHFWAPEIYSGIPISSILLFSTIPKYSIFSVLSYLTFYVFAPLDLYLNWFLISLGLLSVLVGSFAAIPQNRISKILAYSSTAHFGVLLLGLGVPGVESVAVLQVYFIFYFFATFLFFLIWLNTKTNNAFVAFISEYKGLAKKSPMTAFLLSISVFSFMGFPPTLGFFAKLYILSSLVFYQYVLVVLAVALAGIINSIFYIYIIKTIYFDEISLSNSVNKFPGKLEIFCGCVFAVSLLSLGFVFIG